MGRRQSLLAQQLSGYKRPEAGLLEQEPEDETSKEAVANYRRLSTLYGSNIKTVALTKQRKKTLRAVQEENGGGDTLRGGRASPAFSAGSSMRSVGSNRGRLNSAETARTRLNTALMQSANLAPPEAPRDMPRYPLLAVQE